MAKKKRPHPKPNRPSDSDKGFPWGKAGIEQNRKINSPGGAVWAGHVPKNVKHRKK